MDLIAPARDGDEEKAMRNHMGLSAPVPRGRKGKKRLENDEEQAFLDHFAWALDPKYNGENVLCAPYQRHLIRHSNKLVFLFFRFFFLLFSIFIYLLRTLSGASLFIYFYGTWY